MENKLLQVCEESKCGNVPVLNVRVGKMVHNFCCQKGFEKSLEDFNRFVSRPELSEYDKAKAKYIEMLDKKYPNG